MPNTIGALFYGFGWVVACCCGMTNTTCALFRGFGRIVVRLKAAVAQKAQAPRPKGRTGRRFEGEACGKARGVRSNMGEFEGKLPNGLCADSSF